MTIKVGDRVPSADVAVYTPERVKAVSRDEFFKGRKVACSRCRAPIPAPARRAICRATFRARRR